MTPALNWPEVLLATFVGIYRQWSALKENRPTTYGRDGRDAWSGHIEAAGAEMLVAKSANRYWNALADERLCDLPGDVGTGIQVRSTGRLDGSLIFHPERDDPNDSFYLVVGQMPNIRIVGQLRGHECARREYWRNDPGVRYPACFVPQHVLRPVPWGTS